MTSRRSEGETSPAKTKKKKPPRSAVLFRAGKGFVANQTPLRGRLSTLRARCSRARIKLKKCLYHGHFVPTALLCRTLFEGSRHLFLLTMKREKGLLPIRHRYAADCQPYGLDARGTRIKLKKCLYHGHFVPTALLCRTLFEGSRHLFLPTQKKKTTQWVAFLF
jgi:hypothetical protein